MPCLLTTGENAHEIKQASRRRLIRGRLECFYLRKLFPDRLLDIELAAANAVIVFVKFCKNIFHGTDSI